MAYKGIEAILNNLAVWLEKIMFVFAILSIIVNCSHIVVLFKKSMTSSSVTTLLVGIAVVDILSPIYYIKIALREWIWTGPCIPPRGYLETIFNWILLTIRDDCRRCSTWFGMNLALIRMFSIKLALKKHFDFITEAPFGKFVMLVTFVISTIIGVSFFFRYSVIEDIQWIYVPGCATATVQFMVDENDADSKMPMYAREMHLIITGIFEKIIPSVVFPIVTIILIYELKKATKIVDSSVKTTSAQVAKNTQKTNKLVIYMTITFIIIELPIGICKLITAMQGSYEQAVITESIAKILNMIYVPMTCSHCVICYIMSSQYRRTTKKLLRLEKNGSSNGGSTAASGNF